MNQTGALQIQAVWEKGVMIPGVDHAWPAAFGGLGAFSTIDRCIGEIMSLEHLPIHKNTDDSGLAEV